MRAEQPIRLAKERRKAMPAIYEHELIVAKSDIDGLGHANNIAYVAWMQSAAVAHSTAQGWTGDMHVQLGAGWVVRSHQIRYLLPAVEEDQVIVRTWVAGLKRVSCLRRYEIIRRRDQTPLASAATEWAFVDFKTGMPKRIPDEVARAFTVVANQLDPARTLASWTR